MKAGAADMAFADGAFRIAGGDPVEKGLDASLARPAATSLA
jgi:hypothetical protein